MRNLAPLCHCLLIALVALAGCHSNKSAESTPYSSSLGVMSRNDSPTDVAAVRTFYVAPNDQLCMRNAFTTSAPLSQVFADRIAEKLTAQGLTQAPSDMADATVTFLIEDPNQSPAANTGNSQGIGYADQLLAEANALQTKDNFLQNDRVDMRVRMTSNKTHQVIWRGSIAGVQSANEGSRGRLLDMLDAVDKLIKEYPKVK